PRSGGSTKTPTRRRSDRSSRATSSAIRAAGVAEPTRTATDRRLIRLEMPVHERDQPVELRFHAFQSREFQAASYELVPKFRLMPQPLARLRRSRGVRRRNEESA